MAFKVRAEADKTTIYLYDVIHDDIGVSASEFVAAIESATTPIDLRINSPGGDAWAGKAMGDAVAASTVPITAYADGLVASAATLPAIAADSFHMRQGTQFVIHNAWTVTVGDRHDHQASLNHLDAGDAFLLDAYAKRTGKEESEIESWLKAETWFDSQAAIDAGFADEEIAEIGIAALIPAGFNFQHKPDGLAVAASCEDSWFKTGPPKPRAIDKDILLRLKLAGG